MAIELDSDLKYPHQARVIDGLLGTDVKTYRKKKLEFRDQAKRDVSAKNWKKHKASGEKQYTINDRLDYITLPEPVEFYPTKIQIIKGKLADYNTNSDDGGTLISQAMKDAIEKIDVDIHQFIPVEVLDKGGKDYGGQYYYWNIGGEVLDAVNYER